MGVRNLTRKADVNPARTPAFERRLNYCDFLRNMCVCEREREARRERRRERERREGGGRESLGGMDHAQGLEKDKGSE